MSQPALDRMRFIFGISDVIGGATGEAAEAAGGGAVAAEAGVGAGQGSAGPQQMMLGE